MNSKPLIISFGFFIILFLSCKKDSNPDVSREYISASLNPFMFKNGTYWVFQNDSTGLLDSVVVTSTLQDFYPIVSGPGQTQATALREFYDIHMHDYLNNSDYTDRLENYWINRNAEQPILFAGSYIGYKYLGAEVSDKLDSLTVGNNLFINIIKMKIIAAEQYQNEFDHDTYLYFKDSIGLIKKEIDLGAGNIESWSLKRWKINL